MDNAPASLEIILGELTNRDPEIRQAAVDAAMQFGSRDAIPRLKEAVDRTEDPREKVALLEASNFSSCLRLPSFPGKLSIPLANSGQALCTKSLEPTASHTVPSASSNSGAGLRKTG